MKIITLLACACLISSVIVGCNRGGSTTTPATDTVIISGMKFQPEVLQINKGDTVIWINGDLVSHDVTEQPGGELASDTINPGQSWKSVIDHSIDYYCSIHPTMKAKIIVRE